MVNFWIKFAILNCCGGYLLLERVTALGGRAPALVLVGSFAGLLFAAFVACTMVYKVDALASVTGPLTPFTDPSYAVVYAQSLVAVFYWLELPLLQLHQSPLGVMPSLLVFVASFWVAPLNPLAWRQPQLDPWDLVQRRC